MREPRIHAARGLAAAIGSALLFATRRAVAPAERWVSVHMQTRRWRAFRVGDAGDRKAREASATTRPRHTCSVHPAGRDDGVVNHRPKEDVMESAPLLDCAGRRRSPATLPGYHRGRPPRNKGLRYPPDPPTVEEIIAIMRAAGDDPDGVRLRGLIVVLWRAGLRISEALALAESDLDRVRGAIQVRHGKGGRRREVGMDRWAWEAYSDMLVIPT
jgi:integrase